MKAKDYRSIAREKCKKFSGELAIIQLVFELIVLAIGLFGLLRLINTPAVIAIVGVINTIVILLINGPFIFSFINIAKKTDEGKKCDINDLFSGFKRFSQAFIVDLLKSIFIALWSLLLIVPGIIKLYSYSMAEYIAVDDPNITCNDAITKSRQMMKGHKWKLFCLEISYIGWALLVVLTLGILGLWVSPKINQAKYQFYLNISSKSEPVNVAVKTTVKDKPIKSAKRK